MDPKSARLAGLFIVHLFLIPLDPPRSSWDCRQNCHHWQRNAPEWVVGRFFYGLLGRVVTYLLLPLVVGYTVYWVVEYLLTLAREGSPPFSFWESYRTFPGLQVLFAEIVTDASLLVIAFGLFFLAIRGRRHARSLPCHWDLQAIGRASRRLGLRSKRSEVF